MLKTSILDKVELFRNMLYIKILNLNQHFHILTPPIIDSVKYKRQLFMKRQKLYPSHNFYLYFKYVLLHKFIFNLHLNTIKINNFNFNLK